MAIIFDDTPHPSNSNGEGASVPSKEITSQLESSSKSLVDRQLFRKNVLSFNGSSYSGADCKVLVHKYNTPTQDLKADITRAFNAYASIRSMIDALAQVILPQIQTAMIAFKSGSISSSVLDRALQNYRTLVAQIIQTENQIKDTGFYQFIGSTLSNRLTEAQSNPNNFRLEMVKTSIFLNQLITSWQQQAGALESRAVDLVSTKTLAELQTISISTYREKNAVRACGHVSAKGFTRGTRTIAGTMIFTVFDRNVLFELLETSRFDSDNQFQAAIKDQLPPLDLTISFANEYGSLSRMSLYGVEFVTEGQSMSIEDIILEDVCQFVARDVDPMTPVVNESGETYNSVMLNYNQAMHQGKNLPNTLRASDLRGSAWDFDSNNTAGARFRRREVPFI